MRVQIVLSATELDLLLRSLAPLCVDLSSAEEGKRVIRVATVTSTELLPGRGVRVLGAASVEWPVLGINVPVQVDELALDINMALVGTHGDAQLTWNFAIEDADIRHMPEFLEKPIIARVNEALAGEGVTLRWKMGETLDVQFPLPQMLQPSRELKMTLHSPHLEIAADAVTLAATLPIDMHLKS